MYLRSGCSSETDAHTFCPSLSLSLGLIYHHDLVVQYGRSYSIVTSLPVRPAAKRRAGPCPLLPGPR